MDNRYKQAQKQNDARQKLDAFREFLNKADSFSNANQVELVEKYAEPLGSIFADKINRSQIRSFYDTVLQISYQSEDDEQKIALQLAYLRAKTAYKRAQRHITREFEQFIEACTKAIRSARDFEAFVRFFEAVYAYHYVNAKS
jgi:CRISPR type III-A-associated protein Csm2